MLTQVIARVRRDRPKADEVIVVIDCPNACGEYHHPRVDLSDADDPLVWNLPGNCPRCGAMVDTPETIRDLIGTARNLLETAHLLADPFGDAFHARRYCGRCEGTGWYGDPQVPCDECRPAEHRAARERAHGRLS